MSCDTCPICGGSLIGTAIHRCPITLPWRGSCGRCWHNHTPGMICYCPCHDLHWSTGETVNVKWTNIRLHAGASNETMLREMAATAYLPTTT